MKSFLIVFLLISTFSVVGKESVDIRFIDQKDKSIISISHRAFVKIEKKVSVVENKAQSHLEITTPNGVITIYQNDKNFIFHGYENKNVISYEDVKPYLRAGYDSSEILLTEILQLVKLKFDNHTFMKNEKWLRKLYKFINANNINSAEFAKNTCKARKKFYEQASAASVLLLHFGALDGNEQEALNGLKSFLIRLMTKSASEKACVSTTQVDYEIFIAHCPNNVITPMAFASHSCIWNGDGCSYVDGTKHCNYTCTTSVGDSTIFGGSSDTGHGQLPYGTPWVSVVSPDGTLTNTAGDPEPFEVDTDSWWDEYFSYDSTLIENLRTAEGGGEPCF